MKRLPLIAFLVFAIGIAAYFICRRHDSSPSQAPPAEVAQSDLLAADAFESHASNVQVSDQGVVVKLLQDDEVGSRHQRFIVRLASGQTVLISHNIDLAPRIMSLREGDVVEFRGEYEWNSKGGVVHWTHHDPAGGHPRGWVRHNGHTFE